MTMHVLKTVPLPNWVAMLKAMALWLALVGPFLYRKWDAYRWAKWKKARQDELHEIEHLCELFEFMSKTTGRRLPPLSRTSGGHS